MSESIKIYHFCMNSIGNCQLGPTNLKKVIKPGWYEKSWWDKAQGWRGSCPISCVGNFTSDIMHYDYNNYCIQLSSKRVHNAYLHTRDVSFRPTGPSTLSTALFQARTRLPGICQAQGKPSHRKTLQGFVWYLENDWVWSLVTRKSFSGAVPESGVAFGEMFASQPACSY